VNRCCYQHHGLALRPPFSAVAHRSDDPLDWVDNRSEALITHCSNEGESTNSRARKRNTQGLHCGEDRRPASDDVIQHGDALPYSQLRCRPKRRKVIASGGSLIRGREGCLVHPAYSLKKREPLPPEANSNELLAELTGWPAGCLEPQRSVAWHGNESGLTSEKLVPDAIVEIVSDERCELPSNCGLAGLLLQRQDQAPRIGPRRPFSCHGPRAVDEERAECGLRRVVRARTAQADSP